MAKVGIVGIGCTGFRSLSPEVSYKEMVFEAATKAYHDSGIEPKDVDGFVTSAEDLLEGTSIFDEYTPDQLGAVLKPMHTISADGLFGLIAGYMQILTGIMDIIVVEAHSKASNIVSPEHVLAYALDPVYNRPLGEHPLFIAGMEMSRYLYDSKAKKEHCAKVVVKNKQNALDNPYAGFGASIKVPDVLNSENLFYPLSKLDASSHADGAVVIVLVSEKKARKMKNKPVWIRGAGWCSDTPGLETRDWGSSISTERAGEMAYKQAHIKNPSREIDFAEIDDSYSYKELQHMEALRLCKKGDAKNLIAKDVTAKDGRLPVNISGGSIGMGFAFEATGMQRVMEVVLQLRGEAGERQLSKVKTGIAHCWRGIPTTSSAVMILGR